MKTALVSCRPRLISLLAHSSLAHASAPQHTVEEIARQLDRPLLPARSPYSSLAPTRAKALERVCGKAQSDYLGVPVEGTYKPEHCEC